MIKDKWIYQENDAAYPWALYCIKEYTPGCSFDEMSLDVTIYSEDIDAVDNMLSFLNWKYESVSGYVEKIKSVILSFGGKFDKYDERRVEIELCKLFFS